MKAMTNIRREEFGWVVRLVRDGEEYSKHFRFTNGGVRASLKDAKNWRDKMLKKLGDRQWRTGPNSSKPTNKQHVGCDRGQQEQIRSLGCFVEREWQTEIQNVSPETRSGRSSEGTGRATFKIVAWAFLLSMISIKPEIEFQVPFRVDYLDATEQNVICFGRQGQFVVYNTETDERKDFQYVLNKIISHASVSRDTGMVASMGSKNWIKIVDALTLQTVRAIKGDFECCSFGSETVIWTVSRKSPETVQVQKRIWPDQEVLAEVEIADPFNHVVLIDGTATHGCTVYFDGEQDGQGIVLVHEDSDQLLPIDPPIGGAHLAYTHSCSGDEIIVSDLEGIFVFDVGSGVEVDCAEWPEESDIKYVDQLFSLSPRCCIVIHKERNFLFDREVMAFCEELEMPGKHFSLPANGRFDFASVEGLCSRGVSVQTGSTVRLWKWDDALV